MIDIDFKNGVVKIRQMFDDFCTELTGFGKTFCKGIVMCLNLWSPLNDFQTIFSGVIWISGITKTSKTLEESQEGGL